MTDGDTPVFQPLFRALRIIRRGERLLRAKVDNLYAIRVESCQPRLMIAPQDRVEIPAKQRGLAARMAHCHGDKWYYH
jgi:hypothetical protein